MKCRTCGTENPEEARFCMNCSVRLRPLVCLEKDPLPPAFLECEPLPEDEAFFEQSFDEVSEELPEDDDTDLSEDFAEETPEEDEAPAIQIPDIIKKGARMMLFFSLSLVVIFTGLYLLTTEEIHAPYPPRDVQINCEDHEYTFVGAEEFFCLATNAPSSTLDDLQFISYYPDIAVFERVDRDGEIQGKLTAVSEGETYICLDNSGKRSELVLITVMNAASGRQADAIEKEISAIGKVTLDKEDMIHDLRSRYDALSDQAKGRIKSVDILIRAEAHLKKLHQMQ